MTEFLTALYEINGSESEARATAERIGLDQTIEGDASLLPPSIRSRIVGQLESLRLTTEGRYEAVIQYPGDLFGDDCSDLQNILFGTSSLRGDITLSSFTLTHGLLSMWRGPLWGGRGAQAGC